MKSNLQNLLVPVESAIERSRLMRPNLSPCLIALSIHMLLGCGKATSVSLAPPAASNGQQSEVNQDAKISESKGPLSIVGRTSWAGETPVFGRYGSYLKGICIPGLSVRLNGDVDPDQVAECKEGEFVFVAFSLSGDDGVKKIWLSQEENGGRKYLSSEIGVVKNTRQMFNFPGDVSYPVKLVGLRQGKLSDVFSDGNVLVLSLAGGGLVISRDKGKTWYTKSIAQGLDESSTQSFLSRDSSYFATSSDGYYISTDSGNSWSKRRLPWANETRIPANTFHLHHGRLFVSGGSAYSDDNGLNWKQTIDADWRNKLLTIDQNLFSTANNRVMIFNSVSNTWSDWKPSEIAPDQSVSDIKAVGKSILIRVGNDYKLSEDGGSSWRQIHKSSAAFETIDFVGENLIRWNYLTTRISLSISRDLGRSWNPLSSPPEISGTVDSTTSGAIFFAEEKILLRNGGRIALSMDAGITSWKVFELPISLNRSRLNSFKILNGQIFLVFENGLLFADVMGTQWTMLSAPEPSGGKLSGVLATDKNILAWNDVDVSEQRLGALWAVSGEELSFQNITDRLNILDGFYADGRAVIGFPGNLNRGIDNLTFGYSQPVVAIRSTQEKIYISTPEGVAVSSDASKNFSMLRGPQGNTVPLAKSMDMEGSRIAIATDFRGLLLSEDSGKNWRALTTANGLPDNRTSLISISGKTLLLRAGEGLFYSTNFGEKWNKVSFTENFQSSSIIKSMFFKDKLIVHFKRLEQSRAGVDSGRNYLAVSGDFGRTFGQLATDASWGEEIVGAELYEDHWYFAFTSAVLKVSIDLQNWDIIGSSAAKISGMNVSRRGIFLSTSSGLRMIGASVPTSVEESKNLVLRSESFTMVECGEGCKNLTPGQDVPAELASYDLSKLQLEASQCEFSFQTSKCVYTISWSNAPQRSCIWIKGAAQPRLFGCADAESPNSGKVEVKWMIPGDRVDFFLAKQNWDGTPGPSFREITIDAKTKLTIAPCHSFQLDYCTARIEWRDAPVNSCLWGINSVTGSVYLAACAPADTKNPTGHVFDSKWFPYGFSNKFFLALQSSGNPNIPQSSRSAQTELYVPLPGPTSLQSTQCAQIPTSPDLCTATISWSNARLDSCLYVATAVGSSPVACSGARGSVVVNWLRMGVANKFFLATRAKQAEKLSELEIFPPLPPVKLEAGNCDPISPGADVCKVTLSWQNAKTDACLFVYSGSSSSVVACTGSRGKIEIPWISYGKRVEFYLAAQKTPEQRMTEIVLQYERP
ncbi:hypothetical protein EBR21_03515 [bacterium]|nr:hypothetical protein [bacterium]